MSTKTKVKGVKKDSKIELPELKDLKAGKDGYKSITTTFNSEFLKFENVGDVFEGKYVETIEAGKKGEEKPCALFQEKKTGKSFLIGNTIIMNAVEKYGEMQYRITFKGTKKGKSGFKYSDYLVEVK